MGQVSYTELGQNLAQYMDLAVDDRVPILVTRQAGKGNVVILSEEEFEGWQETVDLLSNPANAKRLLESVAKPVPIWRLSANLRSHLFPGNCEGLLHRERLE